MLKNYLLVALRSFQRNKIFSLINIVGLAIGISASLIIFLIVSYEFSFDKFEKDNARIYRVVTDYKFAENDYHSYAVTKALLPAAPKEATGIELAVPMIQWEDNTSVSIPSGKANAPTVFKDQARIANVDSRFFALMPYTWLEGSASTSLNQPYQVVLTASQAHTYYPNLSYSEIIGKPLTLNDSVITKITGIVADLDRNTSYDYTVFVSWPTIETPRLRPPDADQWDNTNGNTQFLVKLLPGVQPAQMAHQLTHLFDIHHHIDPNDHSTTTFNLEPLREVHFFSAYNRDDTNTHLAHKPTLYGLIAVATFLLLLACINFINLTTAQAAQRAKEIGIRKTMGSSRLQLTIQILSETFLLTLTATIFSILLTPLFLKVFADYIPAGLNANWISQPFVIGFLFALVIVVSGLSGIYPALVLSSWQPVLVLKNQAYANSGKSRSAWLRKSLTVSQFVIAQVFIIATILVGKQISYSLNKDMGFKKDAIISFRTDYRRPKPKIAVLMQSLQSIPGIERISMNINPPSSHGSWTSTMTYKDGKKNIETEVEIKKADSNYIPLYHLHLLAGTNITNSDTTNAVILNRTFAQRLGFQDPNAAIGKMLYWDKNVPIIGVIEDFHQKSLHEIIKPLVISNGSNNSRSISIALQPNTANWPATIAAIGKAFKDIYPDDTFDYHFVDESIAKYYTAEQKLSRLLAWATGLAITISCLGLLGLVIYITNQRKKEIGVRKVIGATVAQITLLLSADFIKLVLLAIVISLPIAWWLTHKWLQGFAYRTTISWWIFLAGGGILLGFALLILCWRTFRAAMANPVESLRTE